MIPTYNGTITAIIGPMFGGKTSRLITEKRRNEIAGKRVLLIKHPHDTRYEKGDRLSTHDQISEEGYTAENPSSLYKCGLNIGEIVRDYDVVCIDEGQFYEDTDKFSEELANMGLRVYCSTLLGDYQRKPFPVIANLLALSEDIIFAKAVDRSTGTDASFTKRIYSIEKDETSFFGREFLVGGADIYEAVSRNTYFEGKYVYGRRVG
jgi:thymidine kinase